MLQESISPVELGVVLRSASLPSLSNNKILQAFQAPAQTKCNHQDPFRLKDANRTEKPTSIETGAHADSSSFCLLRISCCAHTNQHHEGGMSVLDLQQSSIARLDKRAEWCGSALQPFAEPSLRILAAALLGICPDPRLPVRTVTVSPK